MDQSPRPLVSIGLPTYNRAFYLQKALDSLRAQTYQHFIILISDNASTDGTRALCETYAKADKRVCYTRRPVNVGQTRNLNDTLQQIIAAADFFMLAADDDLWSPQFLERCITKLIADPRAAMALTGHESFFWEDGRTIKREPSLYFPTEKDLYKRLKQFIRFYSHDNRGVFMYGLWRKSVVKHLMHDDAYESDVSLSLAGLARGYFLLATDEVLYHKGTVPGVSSVKDMPFSAKKLFLGLTVRLARTRNEFSNMAFLTDVSGLSPWQKMKLIFWNLTVVLRLFTRKKV